MAGAYDVVIGGGVEVMSRTPMGSSVVRELGFPFGPRTMGRYTERGGLVGQGEGAELIAEQWGLSREDLDEFSVRSHQRAAQATAEGRFEREIIPVAVKDDDRNDTDELMTTDEGIRPDSSVETLANLKPAFRPENGKVTAGNSSQITDGASGVLVMSEAKATVARSHPPGPVPLLRGGRQRPDHHAHRPDPGHADGPRAGRADPRRHRRRSRSTRRSPRCRWPGPRSSTPTWTRST